MSWYSDAVTLATFADVVVDGFVSVGAATEQQQRHRNCGIVSYGPFH